MHYILLMSVLFPSAASREVFFADERLVPLDHADSNFKINNDNLFSKVSIPRENIHTINTDLLDSPEDLAECALLSP